MIYKKRAVGILGAPVGYAREGETIEGAQQAAQLESGQTVDVLAEARAAKAREFEVQLGYLTKKLDFIQVQALIGQALGGLGRLAKLTDSPDETPLEGSLPVSMNLLAGGYFISRDADGDDWYLWQDTSGYWRVCLGAPKSDTDGQIVGPLPKARWGVDCTYVGTNRFRVTSGLIDIDGITKINPVDVDFYLTGALPSAIWDGAIVDNSWYFIWALPDESPAETFHAVVTRLSQPSAVTATVLTDSTATWIPDRLIGSQVGIVYGTGSLYWYDILDNAATSITIAAWVTTPNTGSWYMVRPRRFGYRARLIGQLRAQSSGGGPIRAGAVCSNYNPLYNDAGNHIGTAGLGTKVNTVDVPFYIENSSCVDLEYRGGLRANNTTTIMAFVQIQLLCDGVDPIDAGNANIGWIFNYLFVDHFDFPVTLLAPTCVGPGLHFVGISATRGYALGLNDPASLDWYAEFGVGIHGSIV